MVYLLRNLQMDNMLNKYSKKTRWIIISIAIFIISAGITLLLINLLPRQNTAVVTSNLTPAALVKQYVDNYKISGYTINPNFADSVISYKPSGSPYELQINATDSAQFARTSGSVASDINKAISDGSKFLSSEGFNRVADQSATNITALIYDNQVNVCKLYGNQNTTDKSSKYGLICATKAEFADEYNTVKSLLTLDKQLGDTAGIKAITRVSHTEGNKSVSLLYITPSNSSTAPYILVYAAIDNSWSYLGKRNTPSIDAKDSFSLPSDLKAAINDPKYGGFLNKYVY